MKKEARVLQLKSDYKKGTQQYNGNIEILIALQEELLNIESILPENLKTDLKSNTRR